MLEDSVVVGRGCVVGEGSAVSKSCVGENVKIGRGASVKNSVVFGDVAALKRIINVADSR